MRFPTFVVVAAAAALVLIGSARADAQPTAIAGYSVRLVTSGGALAGKHLAGISVDPAAGDVYVATRNTTGQFQTAANFTLYRITPAGAVSAVGTYAVSSSELVELEWGPDNRIYTAGRDGRVWAIDPASGAISLYSASGIGLGRYSLDFDPTGQLILMPEADAFYRVIPGGGRIMLGRAQFSHGDRGGVQPDGDYVIFPDGCDRVVELETSSHAVGTPFPTTLIKVDTNCTHNIPTGYSIGVTHPQTGDLYWTTGNFGVGSGKLLASVPPFGAAEPSIVLVQNIGNGSTTGVTDLEFGAASDGSAARTLYFLDHGRNSVWELSGPFFSTDSDGDSIRDLDDNCSSIANPDQADANADGFGDACQPAVDVGPVAPSGPDLRAGIAISDPNGDPLSGVVSVRRFQAAVPSSLTLESLNTCGNDPIEIRLNGTLIWSIPPNNDAHCTCTPPLDSASFGGAALAGFVPGGNNTFAVTKSGTSTFLATIRARIQFTDGSVQTVCPFDEPGGTENCQEMVNLCIANLTGSPVSSSTTFVGPTTMTTFASTPYTNSQLPPFLDLSGVPAGALQLFATTTDGNTAPVSDAEPFTHAGEPRLWINKTLATLSLADLTQTYDGTPRPVQVTTVPAGLGAVTVTYDGHATPPTDAGSYTVEVTLDNSDYVAAALTDTLVIARAQPSIAVSGGSFGYDGSPHGAAATATGVGGVSLTPVAITYNGNSAEPVDAGSYAVQASFAGDANYLPATAANSIIIDPAGPTLDWATPADIVYGTALGSAQLNASANVPGTFIYTPATGTLLGAGGGQTLSVAFTPDSSNYRAANASVLIGVLPLQLSGSFSVADKVYDGNTSATITGGSLNDVVNSDDVSLSGGSAVFNDRHVGTDKPVSGSGFVLAGADKDNYTLGTVSNATADIAPHPIEVTAVANNKVYDGDTLAGPPIVSSGTIAPGDTANFVQSYDNRNAGTGKTLTPSGSIADGNNGNNYSYAFVPKATGSISPKPVAGAFTAADKPYDRTVAASVVDRTVPGRVGSDDVNLAGGSATFSSAAVGTVKTVTLSGASLGGVDAGNYGLTGVDTTTASITALAITGTFTAADKVYDGSTSAQILDRSLVGAVSGDDVSLAGGTAAFSDKFAGPSKPVAGAGFALAGADKDNYSLGSVGNATASISPKPVAGSFTAANKVYDGNAAASITGRLLTGGVSGDDVSLTGGVATFDNPNAGQNKPVTGSAFALGGGARDNYTLASVADTVATITPRPLTITASSPPDIVVGAPPPAVTPGYSGFIPGEEPANSLGTGPTCGTSYTPGSSVGTYPTTCSGAAAPNYAVAYIPGSLKVVFGWNGFLQPINDTAHQTGVNQSKFKAGQTIPAKFVIRNALDAIVQQAGNPSFTRSGNRGSCDPSATLESAEALAPDSVPQFVWDGTQYHYNWSTKGLSAGVYRIYANLADNTQRWVDICLTR